MALPVETAASNLVAMEDAYGLHFMGGTPLHADDIYRMIAANAEVMAGCALSGDENSAVNLQKRAACG